MINYLIVLFLYVSYASRGCLIYRQLSGTSNIKEIKNKLITVAEMNFVANTMLKYLERMGFQTWVNA